MCYQTSWKLQSDHTLNKSAEGNFPQQHNSETSLNSLCWGKFPPIARSVKKKSGSDRSYSLKGEISPINTMLKIYFEPKQMGEIFPQTGWQWQWQHSWNIGIIIRLGEISPSGKMSMTVQSSFRTVRKVLLLICAEFI